MAPLRPAPLGSRRRNRRPTASAAAFSLAFQLVAASHAAAFGTVSPGSGGFGAGAPKGNPKGAPKKATPTAQAYAESLTGGGGANNGRRRPPLPDTDDPLVLLGIDATVGRKEVKAAYRRMAQIYHPDATVGEHNAGLQSSEEAKKLASEDFARINAAYEMLTEQLLAGIALGKGAPPPPDTSGFGPDPAASQVNRTAARSAPSGYGRPYEGFGSWETSGGPDGSRSSPWNWPKPNSGDSPPPPSAAGPSKPWSVYTDVKGYGEAGEAPTPADESPWPWAWVEPKGSPTGSTNKRRPPSSSSSTTTTQQNVPSGSYNPYSFGSHEARSEEWRRAEEATGRARRDEERRRANDWAAEIANLEEKKRRDAAAAERARQEEDRRRAQKEKEVREALERANFKKKREEAAKAKVEAKAKAKAAAKVQAPQVGEGLAAEISRLEDETAKGEAVRVLVDLRDRPHACEHLVRQLRAARLVAVVTVRHLDLRGIAGRGQLADAQLPAEQAERLRVVLCQPDEEGALHQQHAQGAHRRRRHVQPEG